MRQVFVGGGMLVCVAALLSGCVGARVGGDMPHLEKRDGMTKLMVDGRPFICVAGETRNSSSSDVEGMKATWPRLAKSHLNTVLSVVSWDLIESEEGKFDFTMIDEQLKGARENHLRLVLLWMGSWKNGLSHYPPEWVKANQERFPRVKNAAGKTLEILSTLSEANRDADARAFAAVMRHLREVDSKEHTVIAMQVENEVGVLGSSRDFCDAANEAYGKSVPSELMGYLEGHKGNLLPEITSVWDAAGGKGSGKWEEVFGQNVARTDAPVPNSPTRSARPAGAELATHTDEIFMAWNYSKYIGAVAAAGKREYALPMYVNTWIVQPNDLGPGDYPSGGAEPLVQDIWRAGAPAIDILAPDIYLPQFAEVLGKFARNGNPAFNPETSQNGNNCWTAFTELNALCYSPFGIDNVNPDGAFAKTYGLVSAVSGAIAEAQGKKNAIKLITLKEGENPGKVEMGDYVFDFTAVAGRRGGAGRRRVAASASTQSAVAAEVPAGRASVGAKFMESPYVLIIQTGANEFYFATNGDYPFRVSPRVADGKIATAASIDQGEFEDGKWVREHRLNGDDIMGLGYDLSGAVEKGESGTQVPLGGGRIGAAEGESPVVERVRFYEYR